MGIFSWFKKKPKTVSKISGQIITPQKHLVDNNNSIPKTLGDFPHQKHLVDNNNSIPKTLEEF